MVTIKTKKVVNFVNLLKQYFQVFLSPIFILPYIKFYNVILMICNCSCFKNLLECSLHILICILPIIDIIRIILFNEFGSSTNFNHYIVQEKLKERQLFKILKKDLVINWMTIGIKLIFLSILVLSLVLQLIL
jgi:hypothetical protein